MASPEPRMPRARASGLVIERLADETLVYDLGRHRAHCLNAAAALVWDGCDGRTTVAAMAARLERELGLVGGEALVRSGLHQLARARLLDGRPAIGTGTSRRALLRALGLGTAAAALLPVVESIVAPTAAQAASCLTSAECGALLPGQCTGQPICGSTSDCCVLRGQRCTQKKC
jgi:hypothetical protein